MTLVIDSNDQQRDSPMHSHNFVQQVHRRYYWPESPYAFDSSPEVVIGAVDCAQFDLHIAQSQLKQTPTRFSFHFVNVQSTSE